MKPEDLIVVFCDNHLLVVAKPACVPMVPDASGDPSLLEMAKAWVKERFEKPGNVFLGVVQRLDRPVSGVVCLARTSKAARRLTDALRERRVSKHYWGVTGRVLGETSGQVEQWLEKDGERNRVFVRAGEGAGRRRALTRWRSVEHGSGGTLLDLEPLTGRPHQLRLAVASLGSALLGDLKYGASQALTDRSIALHAYALELEHPVGGLRMRFEVPPPAREWWSFAACDAARRRGIVQGPAALPAEEDS